MSTPAPDGMVRNTSWLLIGDVVAKLAGFLFVVIVARAVGRAEYGYFTFAYSFVTLLLLVGRWGLATAVQREIASRGDRVGQVMASALVFLALAGIVVLGVVYALSPLFVDGSTALWTIIVLGLALLADEFTVLLVAVFNALEKMRYPALILIANRVGSTLLAGLVLLVIKNIVAVTLTYLIGSVGALIGAALLARRYLPPLNFRGVTRKDLLWQWNFGLSLGIASLLNAAVFRADALMLQALKGPVAVGLYGAAYRFFESFLFVAWSLGTVLFPRLVKSKTEGGARRVYSQLSAVMLSFYLPLAVGIFFVPDWLVVTLFSERFRESAEAVIWLMAAAAFFSFAYLTRMALIALDHRSLIAWTAGVTLVVNLAVNAILIPNHSFEGAAVATFVASVLEAAILIWFFARFTEGRYEARLLLVPVLASLTMGTVLLVSASRDATALLVGSLVYPTAWIFFAKALAPTLVNDILLLVKRGRGRP